MILSCLLMAAIELAGVTGSDLRARAFFDCNNVKVGDPMTLTLDFIGEADFTELHPPSIARAVDSKVWKVDQASAKTDTFRDARRVTYRVRPLQSGVLRFPALDFKCGELEFRSNPIPVHAKAGEGVSIALGDEENAMPPVPDPENADSEEWFSFRRHLHLGEYRQALAQLSAMAWRDGQTPLLESAMVATRARMIGNPYAELPAWRVVARPLLKYPLRKQLAIVAAWLMALAVCLLLAARTIRHFAAVAVIFVTLSKPDLQVGEPFEFVFSIEPQGKGEISIQHIAPSDAYGLTWTGEPVKVNDRLIRIPARYDVPIRNDSLVFKVTGMVTERTEINRAGFHMVSSSSNSFTENTRPVAIDVKPLDPAGRPDDFSGIVAENLRLLELPDLLDVETNDVITLTYRLALPSGGFVPRDWMPPGAAYNWAENEWKGYFVADGAAATPESEVCYYDPKTKTYRRAKAGATAIKYHE